MEKTDRYQMALEMIADLSASDGAVMIKIARKALNQRTKVEAQESHYGCKDAWGGK